MGGGVPFTLCNGRAVEGGCGVGEGEGEGEGEALGGVGESERGRRVWGV
jgi:hypothetical protein